MTGRGGGCDHCCLPAHTEVKVGASVAKCHVVVVDLEASVLLVALLLVLALEGQVGVELGLTAKQEALQEKEEEV